MTQNTKTIAQPTQIPKKNRKLSIAVVITGGVILLCALLFVCRGWVRVTAEPKMLTPFYAPSAQRTLNSEASKLHDPFASLGYKDIKKKPASCILMMAQSIHTQLDCSANQQSYAELPSTLSGVQQQAHELHDLLAANGWKSGSNGVTLASLVDGITQGKDYSPDAYYEKVIGNTNCVFDTTIAYSNPNPPAINSMFSCDRTVNVFGKPTGTVYDSSKGHL